MQFRHPRAVVLLFIGIIVVMQAAFWLLPRHPFSENEKRVLAEAPQINAAGIADGSVFRSIESYLSDHFPGRNLWVGANACLERAEGRGATEDIVCGTDGWLFTAPVSEDRETLWDNMQAITTFAERQSVPVTMMAVPSAGAVVSDKLPALHLPYPDQSFDIVTIGFGLRNVPDADQVLKEIYRVLKPDGKVGILETSQPTNPIIKLGWESYFKLFPNFAKLLGANVDDYKYLSHTTAKFISATRLKEMLEQDGFKNVTITKLNLGAGAIHIGIKKKMR